MTLATLVHQNHRIVVKILCPKVNCFIWYLHFRWFPWTGGRWHGIASRTGSQCQYSSVSCTTNTCNGMRPSFSSCCTESTSASCTTTSPSRILLEVNMPNSAYYFVFVFEVFASQKYSYLQEAGNAYPEWLGSKMKNRIALWLKMVCIQLFKATCRAH